MTSPALQEIVALLGCPAAGNPAQYLFERAIEAAELDWRFLTLDVAPERIADAITGVAAMGFRGCILSGPLREAAASLVSTATPAAIFSGAVSLIDRQPTGLVGHMTDGRGLMEALRSHIDPATAPVLILGAGSEARAAALELALAGCPGLTICDRNAERATSLVDALNVLGGCPASAIPWEATIDIPRETGIVISTLPAADGRPPAGFTGLRSDMVVADTPLVPQPSPMIALALGVGACAIDGLEIHAETTAIDFHTWAGIETDTEMLREALDEFMS
ncbi:MAG: shikimate dehydrogenase family protein [Planctomycetia bacterium]